MSIRQPLMKMTFRIAQTATEEPVYVSSPLWRQVDCPRDICQRFNFSFSTQDTLLALHCIAILGIS